MRVELPSTLLTLDQHTTSTDLLYTAPADSFCKHLMNCNMTCKVVTLATNNYRCLQRSVSTVSEEIISTLIIDGINASGKFEGKVACHSAISASVSSVTWYCCISTSWSCTVGQY